MWQWLAREESYNETKFRTKQESGDKGHNEDKKKCLFKMMEVLT
jgi:hypothetical protein